jgi:hypothetical protein
MSTASEAFNNAAERLSRDYNTAKEIAQREYLEMINEYAEDVLEYWTQVLKLSETGMTFKDLVEERFPDLDSSRFGKQDLRTIAIEQIDAMDKILKR